MTVQSLADLKVGDTAIVISGRDEPAEVTVIKVARVYLTITGGGWREREFRIDTGAARGNNGVGYGTWLRTREQIEADRRYSAVIVQLREQGLEIRHGHDRDFTVEMLEAILAACQPVVPPADPEPVPDSDDVIRRVLDLATVHLPRRLGLAGLDVADGVVAYGLDDGWLMWVPNDPAESAAVMDHKIPAPIVRIQMYARERGCDYVLFAANGHVVDVLPTWVW